ncbi:phenylalanyl-tRNA synthetase beta chain [gut metagenome]|uniref:Phenylalanyl-tRNA synthetase beta chain n=1 Tax=gut metagenome TaxID=749906 RepID=J9G014_9ZZZZ
MVKCIENGGGKILESVTLFDVYTGDKVGEGKKSLAYNLVFRASDRTLTDQEVEAAIEKILKNLAAIDVALRS